MENLGQSLWQLSMLLQNVESLDTQEILFCYERAFILRCVAQKDGVRASDKTWAEYLFNVVQQAVLSRHLDIHSLCIQMNQSGEFLQGREELKQLLASLDFDDMVKIGDDMAKQCANEAQRLALIELQREVLYMQ